MSIPVTRRRMLGALVSLGMLGVWACNESVTAPTSADEIWDEGVSINLLSTQVILYGPDGVRPGPVAQTPVRISGTVTETVGPTDVVSASASNGMILGAPASRRGSVSERAQLHRYQKDGHKVIDAYVGGSGADAKPAKIYHFVDGKLKSALQSKYMKLGDRWIAVSGQLTLFDENGKRRSETRYQLDRDRITALNASAVMHPAASEAILKSLFPTSNFSEFGDNPTGGGGEGDDSEIGGEGNCTGICVMAGSTLAHATGTAGLAAQALADCVSLEDPNACPEAIELGKIAARELQQAASLGAQCASCLAEKFRRSPRQLPSSGGGGGGGGGSQAGSPGDNGLVNVPCTDWYLITYYVDTGEVISVRHLGCF